MWDSLFDWWNGRAVALPPATPAEAPVERDARGRILRRAPDGQRRLKFVHIGQRGGVGQQSLLTRWLSDSFDPTQLPCVGMDFQVKRLQHGGERLKVFAWPITRGNERFTQLLPAYFRGADGALLLFDITCRATFEHVTAQWAEVLRDADRLGLGECDARTLVGCKSDLCAPSACAGECRREVGESEAEAFAAQHGMPYFETSAKDGTGVHEAYASLLLQLAGEDVPPQERGTDAAVPCAED
jgi:GTPase SAR1 family protein